MLTVSLKFVDMKVTKSLSAEKLLDTKSTDRKMTLLHYIALIVKEKYPELANFYNELHFVDKAAAGETSQKLLILHQDFLNWRIFAC